MDIRGGVLKGWQCGGDAAGVVMMGKCCVGVAANPGDFECDIKHVIEQIL